MSVMIGDFKPFYNDWTVNTDGRTYSGCPNCQGIAMEIIDSSTGKKYLNESKLTVRFKCFLLTLGTPIVHSLMTVVHIVFRLICVLFRFVCAPEVPLRQTIADVVKDVARIVLQPLALVGLQLAAIYGLVRPYDGRKLYATIERAQYNGFTLAPCFQPDADWHLFGGNINCKDSC